MENFNYTGQEADAAHRACGWSFFKDIPAAEGVTAPPILQRLGAMPLPEGRRDSSVFFLRNYGERVASRGGSWFDGAFGGIWELYLRETRAFIYPDIGFRAAYVEL